MHMEQYILQALMLWSKEDGNKHTGGDVSWMDLSNF